MAEELELSKQCKILFNKDGSATLKGNCDGETIPNLDLSLFYELNKPKKDE